MSDELLLVVDGPYVKHEASGFRHIQLSKEEVEKAENFLSQYTDEQSVVLFIDGKKRENAE